MAILEPHVKYVRILFLRLNARCYACSSISKKRPFWVIDTSKKFLAICSCLMMQIVSVWRVFSIYQIVGHMLCKLSNFLLTNWKQRNISTNNVSGCWYNEGNKGVAEILNWGTRVRVVLQAAKAILPIVFKKKTWI